jgi:hypothetical protein
MKKIVKKIDEPLNRNFKSTETQCELLNYSIKLIVACFLNIPKNVVFDQITSIFTKNRVQYNGIQHIDKGIQTFSLEKQVLAHKNSIRPRLIIVNPFTQTKFDDVIDSFVLEIGMKLNDAKYSDLKEFTSFLYQLREESLYTLNNYCFEETVKNFSTLIGFNEYQFRMFEMLLLKAKLKFDNENNLFLKKFSVNQSLFHLNNNSSVLPTIQISKLISYTIEKTSKKNEKRKLALDRFRKLVTVVRANRKWLKTLNNKRKRDQTLALNKDADNEKYRYSSKKAIILFDKDQYKSERSLLMLTAAHRRILSKASNLRTIEEIEMLDQLVCNIAKLNAFPKHIRKHVAQLLDLVAYDKGREMVREGHEAIGFYIITSEYCNV